MSNSPNVAFVVTHSMRNALLFCAAKNNLPLSDYVRAILLDALLDEGFDDIQCIPKAGCPKGRKAGKAGKPAESRDNQDPDVPSTRQEMGT